MTISRGAKPSDSRSRAWSRTSPASGPPRRSRAGWGSASSFESSTMKVGMSPSWPTCPSRWSEGTASSRNPSSTTSTARSQAAARISSARALSGSDMSGTGPEYGRFGPLPLPWRLHSFDPAG